VKEILSQLAAYNGWANRRLSEVTIGLPEYILNQKLVGSFPSVKATVIHMLNAESIWWQRLKLIDPIQVPGETFNGDTKDAVNMLETQDQLWQDWVEQSGVAELGGNLHCRNLKGEPFVQPITEVLVHVFNHGTYHRGQWVNQLRECGVQDIPSTDYIEFSRRK